MNAPVGTGAFTLSDELTSALVYLVEPAAGHGGWPRSVQITVLSNVLPVFCQSPGVSGLGVPASVAFCRFKFGSMIWSPTANVVCGYTLTGPVTNVQMSPSITVPPSVNCGWVLPVCPAWITS